MSKAYQRRQVQPTRRKSTALPIHINEEEFKTGRRLSLCPNAQRRLSTVSQIYLPHGIDYHPQDRAPPTGIENQKTILLNVDEDNEEIEPKPQEIERKLSIVSKGDSLRADSLKSQTQEDDRLKKTSKRVLFIVEPMVTGLIIFPILVLFWETGWNLTLICLNVANNFSVSLHLDEITQEEFESYTWQSLVFPYIVAEIILLCLYLFQDLLYQFIRNCHWLVRYILLQLHIFVLASVYICQWEMMWTIWDQFTPHEWYFELALSLCSLFALIVFVGHLSDLICSPFLFSYDSVEWCIQFGCPLLTREMKPWTINLLNFILYEIIISNLAIITWRGFYHYLDDYFYSYDLPKSAGFCILIGYVLYFPLMYFQTFLEELNLKFGFWTFVSINFPELYRNIRHLIAFVSCVFVWRGFWLLYDEYIYIFEDYYKTYLMIYLLSFIFLSLIQTSSSINGPLSNIDDRNEFFPLYPHCYLSIVTRKLSQLKYFQGPQEENTKL